MICFQKSYYDLFSKIINEKTVIWICCGKPEGQKPQLKWIQIWKSSMLCIKWSTTWWWKFHLPNWLIFLAHSDTQTQWLLNDNLKRKDFGLKKNILYNIFLNLGEYLFYKNHKFRCDFDGFVDFFSKIFLIFFFQQAPSQSSAWRPRQPW